MSRRGFGRRRTVLQLEDTQNKRDNYGLGYRPTSDRTRDHREGNPIGALDMMMHYDDSEEEEPIEETQQGSSVQKIQMFVASSNRLEPTLTQEVSSNHSNQSQSVSKVTNGRSVSPDTTKPKDEIDSKVMDFLAELDAIDGPDTTSGDGGPAIDGEPLPPTPPTVPAGQDTDSPGYSSDEDKPPTEPTTDWQQCLDDGTQCYYYWHFVTNEVTWEIPPEYSQYLLRYKEYEEQLAKYEKEKPKRSERSKHKQKKKRKKKNKDPPPPSSVCDAPTVGPELPQSSGQGDVMHGPSLPSPPAGPVHGPSLPSPPIGPVHGPSLPPPPPGPVHGPAIPAPPSQKDYPINPPLPPGPAHDHAPPSAPSYSETVNPPLPPAIPRPPSPQMPESSQPAIGTPNLSHVVSTAFPIGSEVPPPPPPPEEGPAPIGPELPSSSSGVTQPANQDADDNSSLGEDVDEYIHRKLEEPVYSHYEYINKKYDGPQPSALPTESTTAAPPVVNYEVDDDDLDLDIDDIDRELERALERKQAELQSKEVDSTPMKRKAPSSDPVIDNSAPTKRLKADDGGVSSMPCDVTKSHLLKADIKQRVDTLAEVAELSGLVSDKLDFLEISRDGLSKLRILLIETQTRIQDWRDGALLTEHFVRKLRDASEQLEQYEASAAPPGWSCHWDRKFKRYFYCNEVTDDTQWDYPNEAEECAPTPPGGAPYHADSMQASHPCEPRKDDGSAATAVPLETTASQPAVQHYSADLNGQPTSEEANQTVTFPYGIGQLLAAPPPPPPPCEPEPPSFNVPRPTVEEEARASASSQSTTAPETEYRDRPQEGTNARVEEEPYDDIDGVAMDIGDVNDGSGQHQEAGKDEEASIHSDTATHGNVELVIPGDQALSAEQTPITDGQEQADSPKILNNQHSSPKPPVSPNPPASPNPSTTEYTTTEDLNPASVQSEEITTPSMSPAPPPVTSTEGSSTQEGTAGSSTMSPNPVKEKKKKKDKSLVGGGLSMKKKNVTGLVQKWQKVQKEVEKEMAKQRKAAVLLEEELENQLNG